MELKGLVHEIGTTQQVSDTFKKRSLIIEYTENPSYKEYINLEAVQDKVDLLDDLSVGAEVEVFFNLRGRPWTDKNGKTSYFNQLVIWRVNVLQSTPIESQSTDNQEDSDLPFN